jgi:hypothetical protein
LLQADVLFLSRTYAEHLAASTPGFQSITGSHNEPPETAFIRGVLQVIKDEIKPGASGHMLFGPAGCFCFARCEKEDAVTALLSSARAEGYNLVQSPRAGQQAQLPELFLFAYREMAPLVSVVVESAGAGDSFVAGALWSYLNGSTWIGANALATRIAGRKCIVAGFKGLWKGLGDGSPLEC